MTPDQLRKQYPGARYVTTDASGMMKVWTKARPTCGGPTDTWSSPVGEEGVSMGLAKVKPASAASSLVDIEAVEAQVAKQQAEAQELARQTEEQSKVIQQAFVGLPPPTSGNLSQGDRIRLLTAVVRDLIKLTADGTGGLEEPLRGLLDRLAVLD